jgi:alanyl-tRNA synthetase
MALFGEKYGDMVRVVSMGEWSKELCGGTHVDATGDIGLLLVVSETGIGSGVRRMEALAGAAAYAWVNDLRQRWQDVASVLEARSDGVLSRAEGIMRDLKAAEKRAESLARALAAREAEALLRDAEVVDGFKIVSKAVTADSVEYLKDMTDAVKSRLERGVVVLASVVGDRPVYTSAVTRDLTSRGLSASDILRQAARTANIGGGAGGNPEFAQGGGKDASRLGAFLDAATSVVREKAGQVP